MTTVIGVNGTIFGDFWQCTERGLSIHHDGLINTIAKGGFCWVDEAQPRLMRVTNNIVKDSNINQVITYVKYYIDNEVFEDLGHGHKVKDLNNLFVRGINTYINTTKLMLLPMRELKFHRDTKDKCYFYFKNNVV